jgi:hypothetical protein
MRNSELPLRIGGCGDLAAFYASGASVSEMAILQQSARKSDGCCQ